MYYQILEKVELYFGGISKLTENDALMNMDLSGCIAIRKWL